MRPAERTEPLLCSRLLSRSNIGVSFVKWCRGDPVQQNQRRIQVFLIERVEVHVRGEVAQVADMPCRRGGDRLTDWRTSRGRMTVLNPQPLRKGGQEIGGRHCKILLAEH